jgi:hypothetical protein
MSPEDFITKLAARRQAKEQATEQGRLVFTCKRCGKSRAGPQCTDKAGTGPMCVDCWLGE